MRFLPRFALSVFLLILSAAFCFGTTVRPSEKKCPVCTNTFVVMEIGSWFQWEPARDMAGTLLVAASEVQSCPHCLYSALPQLFDELQEKEREAMRASLGEASKLVRPISATGAIYRDKGEFLWKLAEYRMAEVCDESRKTSPGAAAKLAFLAYHTSQACGAELEKIERGRAIKLIDLALSQKDYFGVDPALWTYLCAELRRLDGQTNEAMRGFGQAEKIASLSTNTAWIADWAKQQAEKANAGDTGADTGGGSAHETGVMEYLRRDLPRMLTAIKAGDSPTNWLLKGEERTSTVDYLRRLAKDGDVNAVNFLIVWLQRLDKHELNDRDYAISLVCRELFRQRNLVDKTLLAMERFRVAALGELVRYAITGEEIGEPSKKDFLKGRHPLGVAFATVSGLRRDSQIKPLLLDKMKKASGTEWRLAEIVRIYFTEAGSLADILHLEAFSRSFGKGSGAQNNFDLSHRIDVESAIRTVRLRSVFAQKADAP